LRKIVATARGLRVPVIAAARAKAPEAVVMPAILHMNPTTLLRGTRQQRSATKPVQCCASGVGCGATDATACVGTFVLAEAALLDGEEATTTWWLSPLFRQRYPLVRLDESRIIVQSNAMLTAGAALSHLDLALVLIAAQQPGASQPRREVSGDGRAHVAIDLLNPRPSGECRSTDPSVRALVTRTPS